MATLEQLEEGIRRAHAAGDANAVKTLGTAYREMQAKGGAQTLTENGQEIGSFTRAQNGNPTTVQVYGTPRTPQGETNPVMDAIGNLGKGAYASTVGGLQGLTMGAYDELASALGTPIKAGERLFSGQDRINGVGDIGSFLGRSFNASREGQKALTQQAYDQAPAAFIAGDLAGSVALGGGMAGAGGTMFGAVAKPTIAGMAGRGAVEGGVSGFGTGFNTAASDNLIDRLSNGIGGGTAGAALGGITGGILGGVAGRQQNAAIPSSKDLQRAAGSMYDDARAAGLSPANYGNPPANAPLTARPGPVTQAVQNGQVNIAPLRTAEFGGLVDNLTSTAKARNVITPEGNINGTYSALGDPLRLLEEYRRTGRPVTVDELLTIRTNIRDAAANPEQKVASVGMDMLDQFNDLVYRMYPDIKQADDLYWRGKTGELIEQLGQLATSRAGQYSQSGMENALRAEFRLLERQIIKGNVKGLPPELVTEIGKVAQGDDIQNFARWVSKFGIQNPVTSITGLGVGLGTGSAIPALAIWGGAQGAGAAARALAFEKYAGASALARSGGNLPEVSLPGLYQGLSSAAGQQGARVPPGLYQAVYGDPRNQ